MANKQRGGKHPPGYICPKRAGKRMMAGYFEAELFAAMHEVADRMRIPLGDALNRACREFVRKHRGSEASADPM